MEWEAQERQWQEAQSKVEVLAVQRTRFEVLRTQVEYQARRKLLGKPLGPGALGQPAVKELEASGVLGSASFYWEHRQEPMSEGWRPAVDIFRWDGRELTVTHIFRDLAAGLVSTEAAAREANVVIAGRCFRAT